MLQEASIHISCNRYQLLLSLRPWNPYLPTFVILALHGCSRISIEKGFGKQSVGKSSVGLGLKQCLHSKHIPSSNLDCRLGGWEELRETAVGTGTEAFPVPPCQSVAVLGFWHWLPGFFAVISNQLSVHFWVLAAFVQISDFLESLGF